MSAPSAVSVAVAACLVVPAAASARSVTIDPVVVSASSILPSQLEHVPGSTAVIDRDALDAQRPFTLKEALRAVPGVHVVDEDSFGLGLNIGIRGLDPRRTSRTLLLEDGMPLFLAPYGDPSAHYSTPLERLQRIEIVKGSGQVLYGPQTVGGMINFVTRPVPKDGVEGSVSATVGNNDFRGWHANVGVGGERGGVMLDLLQKTGDGVRRGHDFDIREATLKAQLNISAQHTLTGKLGHYEEDSHITETGLGAVEYADDPFQAPTARQDRFRHERKSLQLQHIFQISEDVKLTTQGYYVDSERSSFRQINEPGSLGGRSEMDRCAGFVATPENSRNCGGRWRPREYSYRGIEPRLDFRHDLFGVPGDAVIGFRYHEEDIDRKQYRDGDPRAQSLGWARQFGSFREHIDIQVEAKSYYAQNTFHVGDWALTPGVRYEDIRIRTHVLQAEGESQNNPEARLSSSQSKLLPGFGAAWNGIAGTTVFAGVHKGFAPPRPDRDLNVPECNGGSAQDCAIVNRTRPEESTNWELGVRSRYFTGLAFEATLFQTDFDDIVIQDNGRFFNGGESKQAGVELAGRVDFGPVLKTAHNVYLSASYTNLFTAKFKKDDPEENIVAGNRLPYAPKHLLSVALGYQHPVGVDARIGADHVSRQFSDGENTRIENPTGEEGTIPAYTVFNASLNFRPSGSRISYFLSAYNLTDREYLVSRVDGKFAGRERQVFGGIRYRF